MMEKTKRGEWHFTLSDDDQTLLILALGYAAGTAFQGTEDSQLGKNIVKLSNRICAGKHWIPYAVDEPTATGRSIDV